MSDDDRRTGEETHPADPTPIRPSIPGLEEINAGGGIQMGEPIPVHLDEATEDLDLLVGEGVGHPAWVLVAYLLAALLIIAGPALVIVAWRWAL
jgi:hypothetical protein